MPVKPNLVTVESVNPTNVINMVWQNASASLRDRVPRYDGKQSTLTKIGQTLSTNPGLWNEWLGVLAQEIALKLIKSAVYNNPMLSLQKGNLQYGEIIEEIFVEMAELQAFPRDDDKAVINELKAAPANVKTAFHATNFEGQYKITTDFNYIDRAFNSEQGVLDLLSRIVGTLTSSFNSDDRDLVLYMTLRQFFDGGITQRVIDWDDTDPNKSAKNFVKEVRASARRFSNMNTQFNQAGVMTVCKPEDIVILMDADTEADVDVELLAQAFHMDKAQMVGRIINVGDWDSLHEDRFNQIRDNADITEKLTAAQNAYLNGGKLKAIVVDSGAYQLYLKRMSHHQVTRNDMKINHFLNIFKVYGWSPFHNAVAIVTERTKPVNTDFTFFVSEKTVTDDYTFFALQPKTEGKYSLNTSVEENVENGVMILSDGAVGIPAEVDLEAQLIVTTEGGVYSASLPQDTEVGSEITLV